MLTVGIQGEQELSRPSHLEETQNVTLVLPPPHRSFYFLVCFTPSALLHLWSFNFNRCLLDSHLVLENEPRPLPLNKFSLGKETCKQELCTMWLGNQMLREQGGQIAPILWR